MMNELAELKRNRKHGAGNIVLVHGGGVQIDERVRSELKREPEFDEKTGLRITDWETMRIVADVINGINRDLVGKISALGVDAEGFDLRSNVFLGKAEGGKIGRYGRITMTYAAGVMEAVLEGKLAVVAPIGKDNEGALNLNADDAAVAMAAALGLKEILLITNVDGIYVEGKRLTKICGFCSPHLDALMANGYVGKGMKEKVYACSLAVAQGISVKIADGKVENAIAHALDGNAHGTTVVAGGIL